MTKFTPTMPVLQPGLGQTIQPTTPMVRKAPLMPVAQPRMKVPLTPAGGFNPIAPRVPKGPVSLDNERYSNRPDVMPRQPGRSWR